MWTVVVSGPAGKFTRFVTCTVISHLNAMGISSLIKLLHGLGGIFHMPVFAGLLVMMRHPRYFMDSTSIMVYPIG